MKKTLLLALAAVATIFTSCSSDITNDNDDSNNGQGKGMTLIANVEQDDTRATLTTSDDISGKWSFAYTDNDNVKVGNNTINDYYTFTKSGETFSSTDAKVTSSAADWYAYYPDTNIDLTNQPGTIESAAKLYALAGKTAEATTGSTPLKISMDAKAAVLRIVKVDNYGPCDIYLKTKDGKYVSGLKAKKNEAGYEVETSETKVSVFTKESTGNAGIYYVIVPAGVKISIYNTDDNNRINATKEAGLTAGKYYTITTGPTTGTETATLADGTTDTVDWVQLWIGGPRFAIKSVAEEMTWHDAVKPGKDFAWGEKWCVPSKADIKPFVDLAADWEAWAGKSEIKKAGYPTFEPKTDAQVEYNYVQITGYQPGYNKNTLYLYNKIASGNNNYNFWTSDESTLKPDCGCEFQITEQKGIIGAFGISNITYKDIKVPTRPILTAKTVLWENRYVKK